MDKVRVGVRLATDEEIKKWVEIAELHYAGAEERQEKAYSEGYKDEVCLSCNVVFLAHHHFIRCDRKPCAMSNGISLLDMIFGETEQETKQEKESV